VHICFARARDSSGERGVARVWQCLIDLKIHLLASDRNKVFGDPLFVRGADLQSALRWTMAFHEECAKKHSFPESKELPIWGTKSIISQAVHGCRAYNGTITRFE
jgi:hypothetical protein